MTSDTAGVVLAVNAGSGSLTLKVWRIDHARTQDASAGAENADQPRLASDAPLWSATLSRHGDPYADIKMGDDTVRIDAADVAGERRVESALLSAMLERLWKGENAPLDDCSDIKLMGHRIVHGGSKPLDGTRQASVREAEPVDESVLDNIEQAAVFAPLHNPPALNALALLMRKLPDAAPVAIYDTSFHRSLPQPAAIYGGPYEWFERGFRRVGFHGIALEDALGKAAALLEKPASDLQMVVVHLGGGCSATAIRRGESVDTTMGLTPADGMIMAERSGDVDPGLLLHVAATDALSPDTLRDQLTSGAGLKGLSGSTGDIAEAHQLAENGDRRARLAVDAYVLAVRRGVGRVVVSLDRLDALVLNGSALESEAWLRTAIVEGLSALGLAIDTEKNAAHATEITGEGSRARILNFQVDEERLIAETALRFYQS